MRWSTLPDRTRALLVGLLVASALGLGVVMYLLTRPTYAVLFSELGERDMNAMLAELERMKVPYQIGADGHTLLVPERNVHKARMDLMSHDPVLQGGVGFEIFSNSDFGMTEFAQKVNYQRALQGELARTIQATEGVRSARVHLAVPEQSLFRKASSKTTASVTVVLDRDRSLTASQVAGIQRLVSASVPDTDAADVAVFDQRGVALSAAPRGGEEPAASASLDRKQSTEAYLSDKAGKVLDKLLGPGASMVSVDVVFVDEKRQTTVEEVLPSFTPAGQAPTGVTVRERQTSRGTPGEPGAKGEANSSSSSEVDYQVGKRTEQMSTPAGAIRRLNVAVVVREPMDEAQLNRVRSVVAAAVGIDPKRGDNLAVSWMAQWAQPAPAVAGSHKAEAASPPAQSPAGHRDARPGEVLALLGMAAVAASLIGILLVVRRRAALSPRPLEGSERDAVLRSVQGWLREARTSTERSA